VRLRLVARGHGTIKTGDGVSHRAGRARLEITTWLHIPGRGTGLTRQSALACPAAPGRCLFAVPTTRVALLVHCTCRRSAAGCAGRDSAGGWPPARRLTRLFNTPRWPATPPIPLAAQQYPVSPPSLYVRPLLPASALAPRRRDSPRSQPRPHSVRSHPAPDPPGRQRFTLNPEQQ